MTVTKQDEIELNGQKYRIKGAVSGAWLDPFPTQMTIGDVEYSNRVDLSSWQIQDIRGGIGVENMDEKKDWNRCWWTDCIIQYRNHILPPRLATQITKTYPWTTPTSASGADWTLPDNARDDNTGTKATDDTALSSWSGWLEFVISSSTVGAVRVWCSSEGDSCDEIDVEYYDGAWKVVTDLEEVAIKEDQWVWGVIDAASVTKVRVRMHNSSATVPREMYVHEIDIAIQETGDDSGTIRALENFNGKLYKAQDKVLYRLNSARDGFIPLKGNFPANIVALKSSLNSRLYIYQGDTENYWYMSTTEVFTETAADLKDLAADGGTNTTTIVDAALSGLSILKGDYVYNTTRTAGAIVKSYTDGTTTIVLESAIASQTNGDTYSVRRGGTWGFQHDAKLFKVTADGIVQYSTDPDATSPTWNTAGAITDIAAQIEGFVVGRDASGNYVPYAATNSIIKAYDSTTPQWIDTEARLPNHPIGGQGAAYWNGKLYFSYGLAVKEYYPETGAFLDIGLTERDGLPVEYNGEIVKLLGDTGVKGMFASVDASITSSNSKSGLYLYDGFGWQCWWVSTVKVHAAEDTSNTVTSADASDLATVYTLLNEIKDDYNAHRISTTYHTVADSTNAVTSDDASTAETAVALANEIKADYNAHRSQSGVHINNDANNEVTHINCTAAMQSSIWGLANEIKADYNAHILRGSNSMHDIIVSSTSSGYAVYWNAGVKVYYIDIPRGIENPDKISQSYATTGIFISSWFDAGNPVAAKLAKVLEDYAKGITTTETVALKYRLDHTNTDLDTGWVTLDTLNTTAESGHNEELFASGAGLSFKAIQFRLDFVTPGATAKPDIQSLVLYHKKRTGSEKLRVWNVTVICDDGGSPFTTAKQKVANLKSAVISTVDVLFSYHPNDASTEQYYVSVDCDKFSEETGRDYEANYQLVLTES